MDRRRLVPLLIGLALVAGALAAGASLLLDDDRPVAPAPGVRPVAVSEAPPAATTVALVPPPAPSTAPTPPTSPSEPALRSVRVVTRDAASGQALPGARVAARVVGGSDREPSTAIGDAQGVATFAAPAAELEVMAVLPGYVVPDPVRLAAGTNEVELRLTRGRTLRGTVEAEGLAELPPGASVELEGEAAARLADEVALGRDGAFAVEGLARGAVTVVARAPGYAPARRELGPDVTDAGVLALRRARLVARVVAGPDAPLRAGLRVECQTHDAERDVSEVPGGRAEVELTEGQWAVRAVQEGAASPWQLVTVGDAGPVPAEVELRLAAAVAIAGRVLGPDGAPAGGATVTALQITTQTSLTSDAEGRFTLAVTPGDPIQLRAAKGALRSASRTVVAPAQAELHLVALVPVTVKPFVGRDGRPLRGALQVDPGERDPHDESDPAEAFEATFDAEGRPGLSGLDPGAWTVSFVEPAPAGELRAWRRELEAAPGRPVELTFDGSGPRGSVTGRVAGAPRDGLVQVDLLPAAPSPDAFGFVAAAQARPDGGFAFGEVPPGRYRCRASWDGGQTADVEVEVAAGAEARAELGR
jgi:hypothetical protein